MVPDSIYYRLTTDANRLLAFSSFLLSYLVFAAFTYSLTRFFGRINIEDFRKAESFVFNARTTIVIHLVFFTSLTLFVYVIVHVNWDLPIIHLINGDVQSAAVLRVQNIDTYGNFLYNVIARYFIPFSALVFFVVRKFGPEKSYRLYFYLSFIFAILFLIHDVQKAPVLKFFIVIIIMQVFYSGVKFRHVIAVPIIFCLAVIAYGSTKTSGFSDIIYLLERVTSRIFISSIGGMYLSFEWFPDLIDKSMMLQGVPTIVTDIFGLPRYNSAREVMVHLQGDAPNLGVHNSHYIGGAWASLGIFGILVGPMVVALNYYLFQKLSEHFPRSIHVTSPAFYFSLIPAFTPAADYRQFSFLIMLQIPLFLCIIVVLYKFVGDFFMIQGKGR